MEKNNYNNGSTKDRIIEDVLKKINAGEIKMRPRLYFTVKVIIVLCVAFFALAASSLLISLIVFSLQVSGRTALLDFGTKGIEMFFMLFPWTLLLIVVVLLIILEWLLKRFRFCWERSRGQLMALILISSFFFGLIISSTSFHGLLYRQLKERKVPIFGPMYKNSKRPLPAQGIYRGEVTAVRGNIFIIHDDNEPEGKGHLIFAPVGVDLAQIIKVGDSVFVAAAEIAGELRAIGIKKLGVK